MKSQLGKILKLTESKYCTQNLRFHDFSNMVYFVPTWSLFAGLVTYIDQNGKFDERSAYKNFKCYTYKMQKGAKFYIKSEHS